jgi:hypothetical protein
VDSDGHGWLIGHWCLLLPLLHVIELTALVRCLCRGWFTTHHPYDASKSNKIKRDVIACQHTYHFLTAVGAMAETIGLMELDLQRRVTPDGSSVALLVVFTGLSVLSAACGKRCQED